MLESIAVILVRTRFPENIGTTARAMANMGVSELILVNPERWEPDKAAILATSLGKPLLDSVRVVDTLAEAVAPFTMSIGTTARTGGWRTDPLLPQEAAGEARSISRQGGRVAFVFGPEDKGLDNSEIELCSHLVNIRTAVGNSSLNLAQAVLVLLYECHKADTELSFSAQDEGSRAWTRPANRPEARRVTLEEENMLLAALKEQLIAIDHLPADNADWFMKTMRRFLRKKGLRRNEFDMFMGICRQIKNKIGK
ncbi:RNA methyltransferase [Desulfovibrio sp. OttesenSCG-928-C06]|nr:RNA methyltransferase [Desulfovibrio sp. OttesenSCG-928-C06]